MTCWFLLDVCRSTPKVARRAPPPPIPLIQLLQTPNQLAKTPPWSPPLNSRVTLSLAVTFNPTMPFPPAMKKTAVGEAAVTFSTAMPFHLAREKMVGMVNR